MIFSKEQRKTAYQKLSPEIQSFIMDTGTTELILNYLTETRLTEDQTESADSEILYAMYELQSLSDAINNIAKLSNRNINDFSILKTNLENNIFSKIKTNTKEGTTVFNKNKVLEICKKYTLGEVQSEKLLEIVSHVVEPIEPKSLLETITSELGISSLLAEQIVDELYNRVLENKPKYIVDSPPNPITKSTIPEIRPQNLPMQGSNFIPTPKPAFQNQMLDNQKTSEPAPIGVPRYAGDSLKVNTVPSNQNIGAGSIIENKLNNVTSGIREIPTKYEKDPYRETLG